MDVTPRHGAKKKGEGTRIVEDALRAARALWPVWVQVTPWLWVRERDGIRCEVWQTAAEKLWRVRIVRDREVSEWRFAFYVSKSRAMRAARDQAARYV